MGGRGRRARAMPARSDCTESVGTHAFRTRSGSVHGRNPRSLHGTRASATRARGRRAPRATTVMRAPASSGGPRSRSSSARPARRCSRISSRPLRRARASVTVCGRAVEPRLPGTRPSASVRSAAATVTASPSRRSSASPRVPSASSRTRSGVRSRTPLGDAPPAGAGRAGRGRAARAVERAAHLVDRAEAVGALRREVQPPVRRVEDHARPARCRGRPARRPPRR